MAVDGETKILVGDNHVMVLDHDIREKVAILKN